MGSWAQKSETHGTLDKYCLQLLPMTLFLYQCPLDPCSFGEVDSPPRSSPSACLSRVTVHTWKLQLLLGPGPLQVSDCACALGASAPVVLSALVLGSPHTTKNKDPKSFYVCGIVSAHIGHVGNLN